MWVVAEIWFTISPFSLLPLLITATIKTGNVRISPHWVLISCKVFLPWNHAVAWEPSFLESNNVAGMSSLSSAWHPSSLPDCHSDHFLQLEKCPGWSICCAMATLLVFFVQIVTREDNDSNEDDRFPTHKCFKTRLTNQFPSWTFVVDWIWFNSLAWSFEDEENFEDYGEGYAPFIQYRNQVWSALTTVCKLWSKIGCSWISQCVCVTLICFVSSDRRSYSVNVLL